MTYKFLQNSLGDDLFNKIGYKAVESIKDAIEMFDTDGIKTARIMGGKIVSELYQEGGQKLVEDTFETIYNVATKDPKIAKTLFFHSSEIMQKMDLEGFDEIAELTTKIDPKDGIFVAYLASHYVNEFCKLADNYVAKEVFKAAHTIADTCDSSYVPTFLILSSGAYKENEIKSIEELVAKEQKNNKFWKNQTSNNPSSNSI